MEMDLIHGGRAMDADYTGAVHKVTVSNHIRISRVFISKGFYIYNFTIDGDVPCPGCRDRFDTPIKAVPVRSAGFMIYGAITRA
jgi:hypothetical protein